MEKCYWQVHPQGEEEENTLAGCMWQKKVHGYCVGRDSMSSISYPAPSGIYPNIYKVYYFVSSLAYYQNIFFLFILI